MPPVMAAQPVKDPSRLVQILRLSFTGSYLVARLKQLQAALGSRVKGRARILLLILVDVMVGMAVSHTIAIRWPPSVIVQHLLEATELVVLYLRRLITWLMGAPAGLKLNSVLSKGLGKFFLYHIHLWVTFVFQTAPLLSQVLEGAMTILPFLGLCLQLCVAQDVFNFITFHIHCFYAYARRLFLSQSSGLISLWRLFRGKKYNPLRKRVDSSHSNVDQLFLGTLAFTILLFLYPTTVMYFVVFKGLEFAIVSVNFAISLAVHIILTMNIKFSESPVSHSEIF